MTTTVNENAEGIETIVSETHSETKLGPIGRFAALVKRNPIKSAIAVVAAAAGAYLAYNQARDGRTTDVVDDVAEAVAA